MALFSRNWDSSADIAHWLIDLLVNLGRESDACDAVGLVIPGIAAMSPDSTSEEDLAGPLEPGVVAAGDSETKPVIADDADVRSLPAVHLHAGTVPADLDPGRFFGTGCESVLERTPINFHVEARRLRQTAR